MSSLLPGAGPRSPALLRGLASAGRSHPIAEEAGGYHHAQKMRALLAAVLLLRSLPAGRALCFESAKTRPDLSNQSSECPVLDWSEFSAYPLQTLNLSFNGIGEINGSATPAGSLKELDLSFNCLQSLPWDFLSQAQALTQLHLQHNKLQALPSEFFQNASRLETLSLQGNPLPSVPASAFHRSLLHLAVDCRCDVVGSAVHHCTCSSSANCTERTCHCLALPGAFNLTEFYARECRPLPTWLFLAIAGSVLLLLAGVLGAAFFLLQRQRKASVIQGKRESTTSMAHGQPRYISRGTKPAAEQGTCQAGDYENIFIGHAQPLPAGQYECLERKAPPYRVQQQVDEECYMESDTCLGDQPIYGNTQHLASSFSPPHDAEDVYIIPDK
ncbi:leucine-rich repeat-containing protein 25-like [Emydura macquarii macquarii]|uniref:leucine-rich repeat-containing protein 25-like n=1 Tax=Emydura macquarii macquarii TaxID=1129001 RepID=UPI00352A4BC4